MMIIYFGIYLNDIFLDLKKEEGNLSRKMRIFLLLTITVLSTFGVVNFVPPAKAGPGGHRVYATFYQAYIIYDEDIFGAGEWYFSLAIPTAVTAEVGPYSANNDEMVDFTDRSYSYLFTNKIEYWCIAREDDSFPETGPGYENDYPVTIDSPWDYYEPNSWYDRSSEWGGVVYYYSKFYIENKRPTVSAIDGTFSGYRNVAYTWTTTGSDPEGDSLGDYYWYVDEELKQTSSSSSFTYTFPTSASIGDHIISVRVEDYFGRLSLYKYKLVEISNRDPKCKDISGPSSGYTGVSYEYSTIGSDPDGDPITFQWKINDVTHTSTTSTMTNTFKTTGEYTIGVRTRDNHGAYSDWKYKAVTITSAPTYTLTVNIVGNGDVTAIPDQVVYGDGTVVTLTANPDSGWAFSGWSGDLGGSDNPESITMNGDKTVTATFTEIFSREALWDRLVEIILAWPTSTPEERAELWEEIVEIILLWPTAP
jgi:uncharacterized repeat protein (TIGR02543 family)